MRRLVSSESCDTATHRHGHLARLAAGAAVAILLSLACGSESGRGAGFEGEDPAATDAPKATPGASSSGGASGSLGAGLHNGGSAPAADAGACASTATEAKDTPVYMAFIYDRSSSMQESSKWAACKAGVQSYFASPASKGTFASLTYFPQTSGDNCAAGNYSTPKVPMTPLPNTTALKQSLDKETPEGSNTPTRAALEGTLNFAKAQAAGPAKDGKVVVVLVTDGDPTGCLFSNTIQTISDVAKTAKDQVPTFVIGVGNIAGLNAIAAAGGTKQAIIVSTGNAAKTEADLKKAIESIRESLSCDYTMPSPPEGETFDAAKVNVVHTKADGQKSELSYNQDCTGPGWRYDNVQNPKHILICESSCNSLKASPGKVQIEYGCETKGDLVK
jgi:hypothetical protein